jgi:hypothetical protein
MIRRWIPKDPKAMSLPTNLRIDTHTHILPEFWPDLKERYGFGLEKCLKPCVILVKRCQIRGVVSRYGYGGFVKLVHSCDSKATMFKDDGTKFRDVDNSSWYDTRLQPWEKTHD